MKKIKVYTKEKEIELKKLLGRGGEGEVYEVDENLCAKIYLKPDKEKYLKLKYMIENPPEDFSLKTQGHRSIIWPQELLFFDKNLKKFAGFLMPKVNLNIFFPLHNCFSQNERIRNFGISFSWKHLISVAVNIAGAVASLHEKGYCIGDLNDRNILVAKDTLVVFLDCDSYQVHEKQTDRIFLSPVRTPEYTPPEMYGKFFKKTPATIETDNFALAVIIFKILMLGFHPFAGKYLKKEELTLTEKIKKGLFAYSKQIAEALPPDSAPDLNILPPYIQNLFEETFITGYKNPSLRPDSKKWWESLLNLLNNLKKCKNYKHHYFSSHLKECPWCSMAKRGKVFFPVTGSQIRIETEKISLNNEILGLIEGAAIDGVITDKEEAQILKRARKLGYNKKEIEYIKKLIIRKRRELKSKSEDAKVRRVYMEQKEEKEEYESENTGISSFAVKVSFIASIPAIIEILKLKEFSIFGIAGLTVAGILFFGWVLSLKKSPYFSMFFTSMGILSIIDSKFILIFLPFLFSYSIGSSIKRDSSSWVYGLLTGFLPVFIIYNSYSIVCNRRIWFYNSLFEIRHKAGDTEIGEALEKAINGTWQRGIYRIKVELTEEGIRGKIIKPSRLKGAEFRGRFYTETLTFTCDVSKGKKRYGKIYGRFIKRGKRIKYLQIYWHHHIRRVIRLYKR